MQEDKVMRLLVYMLFLYSFEADKRTKQILNAHICFNIYMTMQFAFTEEKQNGRRKKGCKIFSAFFCRDYHYFPFSCCRDGGWCPCKPDEQYGCRFQWF